MGKVGESAHDAGSVYSDYVPDFIALERLTLPPTPWLVFIAADTSDVVDAVLARVAERFVSAGVSVVSVWGPDCERVHDMFDDVYVGDGTTTRDATDHHVARRRGTRRRGGILHAQRRQPYRSGVTESSCGHRRKQGMGIDGGNSRLATLPLTVRPTPRTAWRGGFRTCSRRSMGRCSACPTR